MHIPPERPDIVRWGDVPMDMASVVGCFERSAFNVVYTAMPEAHYALAGRFVEPAVGPVFYYLRATQDNGQLAWSSPVWFEG